MTERVAFLDARWIREEEFCEVMVLIGDEIHAGYAIRPGECLPELPTENVDWYVYGSEEPFDITQPIYESMYICKKERTAS